MKMDCPLHEEYLASITKLVFTMRIDSALLDSLTAQAKASPRLRMNFDLRTSPEDSSQRMLNALLPGTVLPIHRHTKTTEVLVLLRGKMEEIFYEEGRETGRVLLEAGYSSCRW